ncbi:MAG: polysaccharide deacetylase [Chloroflexi bacterium]|nr:polysaccharide deacetylase [Chloroflexota bacterium]
MAFPIMLTFDMDAESTVLAIDPENARRPGVLSPGQYGPTVAVYRILDMLKQEGVPATFFVPGWTADYYPAAMEALVAAGCEVGHHGYTHTLPYAYPSRDAEEDDFVKGIEAIERHTGKKPIGYRSPAWDYSPHTLAIMEKYGFLYSTNFQDYDAPYMQTVDGRPTRIVELPVSWLTDDMPYFVFRPPYYRPLAPASHPYEIWTEELRGLHAENKIFVLTMHPYLTGRPSRIAMLRRVIAFARSLGNVEFRQCGEYAREFLAAQGGAQ